MIGLKPLLAGLVLGSGGMYFAHQYHVLNSSDGVIVVPRAETTSIADVYADIRGWSPEKWADSPQISAALLKDGRTDLMTRETASGLLGETKKALDFSGTSASNEQATETSTPEIIFRPSSDSVRIPKTESAAEESLLDRLSRQLQQSNENETLQERPLIRETTSQTTPNSLIQPATIPTDIVRAIVDSTSTVVDPGKPSQALEDQAATSGLSALAELGRPTPFPEVFEDLSQSITGSTERSFQSINQQIEKSIESIDRQSITQFEQRISEPMSSARSNSLPIDGEHVGDRIPSEILGGLKSIVRDPQSQDGDRIKLY